MKKVFGISATSLRQGYRLGKQTAGRIIVGQPRTLSGPPTISAEQLLTAPPAAADVRTEVRARDCQTGSSQGKRLPLATPKFDWLSPYLRATVSHEELSQNPVFDPDSCTLHGQFRGRPAELREDG
jgi:hypothetical protein